jgi:hypothetical protein
MKFRNYCLVVFGNSNGIMSEVISVSEIEPNVLDAKGIKVLTFTSNIEPKELNDYFRMNGRNFLIFDLSPEHSGFNFQKRDIMTGLFGYLKQMTPDVLKEKSDMLMKEFTEAEVEPVATNQKSVSLKQLNKMSSEEKNELLNTLIEKGINKTLTKNDEQILKILTS